MRKRKDEHKSTTPEPGSLFAPDEYDGEVLTPAIIAAALHSRKDDQLLLALSHSRVRGEARQVFDYIWSSNMNNRATFGTRDIARHTRVMVESVARSIKELGRARMIRYQRVGRGALVAVVNCNYEQWFQIAVVIKDERRQKRLYEAKLAAKRDLERAANYQPVIDRWNKLAKMLNLSVVKGLSEAREAHLRMRLKEADYDFEAICSKIAETPFLLGQNKRGWKVNFDFVIKPSYRRILEGVYTTVPKVKQQIQPGGYQIP